MLWTLLPLTAAFARPPARPPEPDLEATAAQLLGSALTSDRGWERLETLCLDIGHRLSGSPALDQAIAWGAKVLAEDGLQVRTEPVTLPVWERGLESLTLISPQRRELLALGLGWSLGTPPGGLTAEVLVVDDFAHLERLPREAVQGKVVLWDVPWTTYGETVAYRGKGALAAAEKGAVASLIRSVTPESLATPHTGAMSRDATIPGMAITVEDAVAIRRWTERGQPVKVQLEMGARRLPDAPSANVVGDLPGRQLPQEVVLLGCHLDSWDVGQGAQDDGAGCAIVIEAARLIAALPVAPRRTVRVVLFTNEESGLAGGRQYAEAHRTEVHTAVIEADTGSGAPLGFRLDLGEDPDPERYARAEAALAPLRALLVPLGAARFEPGGAGADVGPIRQASGALGLGLAQEMHGYWRIHHTQADTLDKVDPQLLRRNAAAVAVAAWWLAESPDPPRGTAAP